MKPRKYVSSKKVWLNHKYIKTKQNSKLKAKFFGFFQVLDPIENQAYKLNLSKMSKTYDIFYISLLKRNITWKKRVDERIIQL